MFVVVAAVAATSYDFRQDLWACSTNIRRHQASFVPRHRRAAKETGGSLTHDRKISTAQEEEKHGRRLKENKFAVQVAE